MFNMFNFYKLLIALSAAETVAIRIFMELSLLLVGNHYRQKTVKFEALEAFPLIPSTISARNTTTSPL